MTETDQNAETNTGQYTYVDVLCDGPPSHDAPRFVELEDPAGRSISFGQWVARDHGYWALRIPTADARVDELQRQVRQLQASIQSVQQLVDDNEFGTVVTEDLAHAISYFPSTEAAPWPPRAPPASRSSPPSPPRCTSSGTRRRPTCCCACCGPPNRWRRDG